MNRRWLTWLLAGCAIVLIVQCFNFRESLIDDTFIVFRYADHLLAGQGPVFNPGERVEGFTSPLWLLLLAAARAVGASYESAVLVLGTAFAVAALFPAYGLARRVAPEPAAIAAPLLLAAHPGLGMWAVHGLESSLFLFLTALGTWLAARSWETNDARAAMRLSTAAGAVAGLAFWTRPEGALWGVAFVVAATALGKRREAVRVAAAAAAVAVPLEIARFAYYGALVPNTYFAKAGGGLGRLGFGVRYAKTFVYSHALVVLACLISVVPLLRSDKRRETPPLVSFACLFGAVWSAYVVWEGGDAFPGYRFWLPVLPLAGLLVARALSLGRATAPAWAPAAALLVAVVTGSQALDDVRIEHETGRGFTAKMSAAGRWLGAHVPPGTWIAVNYVGALPYYSGLPTIDMLGLTDPAIARTPIRGAFRFPGHAKGNGASVLDRAPGLILMGGVSLGPRPENELRTELASEDEIAADPRFAERYERVEVPIDGPDGRDWFEFYVRKDLGWKP